MGTVDGTSVQFCKDKTWQDSTYVKHRIDKLPSPEEIEELCSALSVSDLRQLTAAILNASIAYIREETDRLEYVTLLNSWIATVEETVVAGRNVNRIAARRKARNGE